MYSEDTLLRLIDRIYDAALAPELWPQFLEALAETMDSSVANIGFASTKRAPAIAVAVRFDPEASHRYHEHYARLDPWANAAPKQGLDRTGVVTLSRAVVSPSDYEKSEFYADYGKTYGLIGGVTAVIRADPAESALLSVFQTVHGREFDEPEVLLLRRLLPHLQRAFQLHERFAGMAHARSAAEEVIDRFPFGVVLVDGSGRAGLINRAARQVLDSRDGVMLRDRSLVTAHVSQTTELRTLIAGAIAAAHGGPSLGSGGALSVGRPSMKRPLQLLVTPLRAGGLNLTLSSAAFAAAVFITDPERRSVPESELLRACFQFTHAEARVVRELLDGLNVKDISAALSLTENTVRGYLKTILAKTGCRSQSALIALLLRSVAALRSGRDEPH